MLLGALLGVFRGWVFSSPYALDPNRWALISPTLDASIENPGLGRGAHVVDGALVIRAHALQISDTVIPTLSGTPASVELSLAPGSGPVVVMMDTGQVGPKATLHLRPTQYALVERTRVWTDRDDEGPWRLTSGPDGVFIEQRGERVQVATAPMRSLEFSALAGEPRIDAITITAADGALLFDEDFEAELQAIKSGIVGALCGGIWGWALGAAVAAGGVVMPLLAGTLPLWVLLVSDRTWLVWVEQAYLTRTPYWVLAATILAFSLLPILLLALLRAPWTALRPAAQEQKPIRIQYLAAVVFAGLCASRDGLETGPAILVFGWLLLLSPFWFLPRLSVDGSAYWRGELPPLVALAAWGWPLGLPVLAVWRSVRLAGSPRFFLTHAPRRGVDLIFGSALLAVLSIELGVRASYLDGVWRPDSDPGNATALSDWRLGQPTWRGRCGPGSRRFDRTVRVAWAGGSSTGGAYQFREDPTAFFPAQAHQQLCDIAGAVVQVETYNFGGGARDTFTISRTVDRMLHDPEVDLLVLYVGVNDLFTKTSEWTRKQQETAQAEAGLALGASLRNRSRALTGLGWMMRPSPEHALDSETVSAVPLADAQENLDAIAVAAAGTADVLIMVELLRTTVDGSLAEYGQMVERVAARHDHVDTLDLDSMVTDMPRAELMADRNHFTRAGAAKVGAVLGPELASRLGLSDAADRGEGSDGSVVHDADWNVRGRAPVAEERAGEVGGDGPL